MEFLALILPIVIDTVTVKVSDTYHRFWVSFAICALVGVLLNWISTQFVFDSPQDGFNSITASIMVTFGLAQLSYKAAWERSETREKMIDRLNK